MNNDGAAVFCKRLLTAILLSLLLAPSQGVIAEPAQAQNPLRRVWERFVNRPQRSQRPETVGRGGANRDRCPYTEKELVALVPVNQESGIPFLEQTLSERPTWRFYVPYQPKPGQQVEFVLLDAEEKVLSQEVFPLLNTPGIVSVSLPESVSSLEINRSYRWVFSVICNPANRSADATVNGWIERISPNSLTTNVEDIAEGDRYSFYIDNLLWFDAINELFRLQILYPNNPTTTDNWSDLIQAIGPQTLPEKIQPIDVYQLSNATHLGE